MIFIEFILPLIPIFLIVYYLKLRALPQLGIYAEQAVIGAMLLDYFGQFLFWQKYFLESDEDSAFLFRSMIFLIESVIIYALDRYVGPHIDHRNIRKTQMSQHFSIRSIIAILLVLINPIYTVEIILWGCGYGGIRTFFSDFSRLDSDMQDYGLLLVYAFVIYVAVVAWIIWQLARIKMKDHPAMMLGHINSSQAPILFLRSFELNKSSVSMETFDEHLCNGFNLQEQPVISLADPDIAFADGTIKIQARDLSWKQVIAKLLRESRAVIMFEGKSDGLKWEIENIKKYVSHECFFVATPPEHYRVSAWVTGNATQFQVWWVNHFSKSSISHAFNFIWKKFSTKLNSVGINVPTEEPGSGSLICFNRDWSMHEIISGLDGSDFFKKILDLTRHRSTSTFDYEYLQQSVGTQEVSGTLTTPILQHCQRFVRTVNLAFLAVAVLLAIVIAVI